MSAHDLNLNTGCVHYKLSQRGGLFVPTLYTFLMWNGFSLLQTRVSVSQPPRITTIFCHCAATHLMMLIWIGEYFLLHMTTNYWKKTSQNAKHLMVTNDIVNCNVNTVLQMMLRANKTQNKELEIIISDFIKWFCFVAWKISNSKSAL